MHHLVPSAAHRGAFDLGRTAASFGRRSRIGFTAAFAATALAVGGVGPAQAADQSVVAPPATTAKRKKRNMVRSVQRELGVTPDGQMGPSTKRALKGFQRREGLKATGRVDRATRAEMGIAGSTGGESGSEGRRVRLTSDQVEDLQETLGVDSDGEMGRQTRRALKRAERKAGMRADGRPDDAILRELGVDLQATPDDDAAEGDSDTPSGDAEAPAAGNLARAVSAARKQIGTPYSSGGTAPGGFDCSGLVVFAMKRAGVKVPRTSFDQYGAGTKVAKSDIRAGDLVFFNTAGPGASDVGIASSATKVISATTHGVKEHAISDGYWGSHYVGARRVGS